MYTQNQDYLKNYSNTSIALASILELTERTRELMSFAKQKLITSMKEEIREKCSADFMGFMNMEVSKELKDLNLFGEDHMTNLDYLTEVIFYPLTKTSHVIGLRHFVAPGATYEESNNFFRRFINDFNLIKEIFGLEYRELPSVKVGYAIEFYC